MQNVFFIRLNFLDTLKIIIVLLSLGIIAIYFNFTADDAYIYMRYAVNLIESKALVYNLGEQINTLTSPLMAFLDALLYFLFTDITLSIKILSLFLLFLSVALILKRFKGKKHCQLVILSMVALSPCVLLWTVGGMDTMITLFFATVLTLLVYQEKRISDRTLFAACFLAGLLFFTRYDSILFTAPLLLHSFVKVKSGDIKKLTVAAIMSSMIPLSWVLGTYFYYGEIFPTSLYVKSPQYALPAIISNACYIFQYLFFINATSFILLLFFSVKSPKKIFYAFWDHFPQYWGLYVGIIFLFIYGLFVATTHMMFSFRYFVPYIPALSIIIADYFWQFDKNINDKRFITTVILVISFQIFQAFYTYQISVNGIVLNGEFKNFSIKTNIKGTKKIGPEIAFAIKEHWNRLPISIERPPRIWTPAEGIIPFSYREAYIYGWLVSYRHYCKPFKDLGAHADYIIVYTNSEELKKKIKPHIIKIVNLPINEKTGEWLVVFNPEPHDHILSDRINKPCEVVEK